MGTFIFSYGINNVIGNRMTVRWRGGKRSPRGTGRVIRFMQQLQPTPPRSYPNVFPAILKKHMGRVTAIHGRIGKIAACFPFIPVQPAAPRTYPDIAPVIFHQRFDNQDPISKLRGHWLEYPLPSGKTAQALATFHPAYLLRNSGQKSKAWADLLKLHKEGVG